MTIDRSKIDPDKTYTIDFGMVKSAEIDLESEATEVFEGEHRFRLEVTGQQLLDFDATGKLSYVTSDAATELAVNTEGELIEHDDATEGKNEQ